MASKKERVPPQPITGPTKGPKLSPEEVWRAREMWIDGYTRREIADELGVSIMTIGHAIHGQHAYKDV